MSLPYRTATVAAVPIRASGRPSLRPCGTRKTSSWRRGGPWYTAPMRREAWARLAAPFPPHALDWCVVEIAEDGRSARLEPVLAEAALVERLDEVVGVEGWCDHLHPASSDALAYELELDGVRKSVLVQGAFGPRGLERLALRARTRAAARFGVRPPADERAAYWVDIDPVTVEPLYTPDALPADGGRTAAPDGVASVGPRPAGVAPDGLVADRSDLDESVLEGSGPEESVPDGVAPDAVAATRRIADGDRAAPDPSGGPADAGTLRPAAARADGREVIERLVERLKGAGRGREAAALVVEFGGYGRTADEARELYRRLRELLIAAEAGAGA